MVSRLAKEHSAMITVEESSIGGFGSHGTFDSFSLYRMFSSSTSCL